MAESSWPGKAPATVTEHMHELLWSAYYQSGLVGPSNQSPLIYADSTGLHVKARAGRLALVRGQMWTSGDTDVLVEIGENTSGATRLDRVVLRLDRSTWNVRLAVVEGTPGSSTEPTIAQNEGPLGEWDLWQATVTVANNATTITPADVQARNQRLGGQLVVASGNQLADPGLPEVFLRWRPDQNRLILHREGAPVAGQVDLWSDSGEIVLASSNSAWSNSGATPVIRKIGNTVHLRTASYQRVAGNLGDSVDSRLPGTIPAGMRPRGRDQYFYTRSTGHNICRVIVPRAEASTAGAMILDIHPPVNTGHNIAPFTATWTVP